MATKLANRAGDTGYDEFEYGDVSERRQNRGTYQDRRRDGGTYQEGRYQQSSSRDENADQLARFLGWFSIGLGLAEVLAPRQLARLIGVENRPGVFRMLGFREIGAGVAILSQDQPAGGVWSRVAGDLVDLALLGTQLDSNNPEREKTIAATISVLGVTALDLYTAKSLSTAIKRLQWELTRAEVRRLPAADRGDQQRDSGEERGND